MIPYKKKRCPVEGCKRFAFATRDKQRSFCMFHECHAAGCYAKIAEGLHCAQHTRPTATR